MGHSLAEMCGPLDEPKIKLDYEKRCAKEIDKTLKKNEIKIRDIDIGEKLTLFKGLKEKTKVKVLKSDKKPLSEKIKENLYTKGLYDLVASRIKVSDNSPVKVYEIDYKEKIIRIAPKNPPFQDQWVDIRYLQKVN